MTPSPQHALAGVALLALSLPAAARADALPPVETAPVVARLGVDVRTFQEGPRLVWRIDARRRWRRDDLERRRLCLVPAQRDRSLPGRIACLVVDRDGVAVRREHESADGRVTGRQRLPGARVSFRGRRIRIAVPLDDLGLHPGTMTTRTRIESSGPDCAPAPPPEPPAEGVEPLPPAPVVCTLLAPRRAASRLTLVAGPVTGCVASGDSFRRRGDESRRAVALTFDDGPTFFTPRFLDLLRSEHVHATFFMLGRQIAGSEAIVRRVLAEGHDIGNHSWAHRLLSGGGESASEDLRMTSDAITRAAGVRPCLFRAPYGGVSDDLIARARAQGMLTIQWSADPYNWQNPGSGAIASRVLAQASPGGILLMHDGGGDRSQTLAALPTVIAGLRDRGYELVTVTDLLDLDVQRGWPEG